MRQIITILTLGLLISCEVKQPEDATTIVEKSDNAEQTTGTDFIEQSTTADKMLTEKCGCSDFDKFRNYGHHKTDLNFYTHTRNKNDSIFNLYSADSLRLTIKSIRFSMFDTIPKKFSVFKNVEHIVIESRKNISGLDIFPNLKSVFFWGSQIDISLSEKWLSGIEGLYAEKSVVKGLLSFKTTSKLKDIFFGHSRLEPFPADFDKLKCLRRITLGAYLGEIDLSKIDLSLNPCIEKVEFNTWSDSFSGIPQGLDTNRTFKLIINHQKLTNEEKEVIKTFNEKKKKLRQ